MIIYVIDTETTGLVGQIDVLRFSSQLYEDGKLLDEIDELFSSKNFANWNDAEKVHNITPKMVENKISFIESVEVRNKIQVNIDRCDCILGYGVKFDINRLKDVGIRFKNKEIIDLMKLFSLLLGVYDSKNKRYKYHKLNVCVNYFHYQKFQEHNSLEDVKATYFCYIKFIETIKPNDIVMIPRVVYSLHNNEYFTKGKYYEVIENSDGIYIYDDKAHRHYVDLDYLLKNFRDNLIERKMYIEELENKTFDK